MTEFGVVEVLATLVGLFITIGIPILKLIASITRLTVTVEALQKDFTSVTAKNTESHRRIWARLEGHDQELADQDGRIKKLEGRVEGYHGK